MTPVETRKRPAGRLPAFPKATPPSESQTPIYSNHTAAAGREIWMRDELFLADLSPHAKLLIAHVAPWKITSYTKITSVLPFGDDRLAEAIREARENGWLTMKSGREMKKRHKKLYPPNEYHAIPEADARSKNARGYYTRLAVTPDLGRSAGSWLLRINYLRQQFIAGAIRQPDAVAADLAGLSKDATERTRQRWLRAGVLERLDLPTMEPRIATLALTSGPYPLDLARFDSDHRKTVLIAPGIEVWATSAQADFLVASPAILREWALAQEQPILAKRLIAQMPPDEQPRLIEKTGTVVGADEVPF
jgi:hypothetical protein